MIKKLRLLLLTMLFTVCGTAFADGWSEDFSGLSLVDNNGDPVGTYQFGTGLSNGWKVVGGTIYRGEGSTNYGYISTGGHTSNNGYLEASYGASNSASVWVSAAMPGDELTFWIKCTSGNSSTTGYYKIYEANADGSITTTVLGEGSLKGGSAWTQKTVEGVNGKYIAINLIRMQIDDMECNTAVVEVKDLAISQVSCNDIDLAEQSHFVTVVVVNNGNVDIENAPVSIKATIGGTKVGKVNEGGIYIVNGRKVVVK